MNPCKFCGNGHIWAANLVEIDRLGDLNLVEIDKTAEKDLVEIDKEVEKGDRSLLEDGFCVTLLVTKEI
jgi:hypothetical protein